MKQLIYILCWFLGVGEVLAQPGIEWQKCLGGTESDEARSIQQTSDGGYICIGRTLSNNGDVTLNFGATDFWVVKLDASGELQWQKCLGGPNHDAGYSIQETQDGGFIVTGYTESNLGQVLGNHGGRDVWVAKINASGTLLWQNALGGNESDAAYSLRQTADNGYILAGRSNSIDGDVTGNHGYSDFWIVKLNQLGILEWEKSLGGSLEDVAYSIKQTTDGGYVIAGETGSSDGDVTGFHGASDYWVVKLSPTGEIEWQRALGSDSLDRANDVIQAADGGYVVVGEITDNNGDVVAQYGSFDWWVVKLTNLGEIEWQKTLGGSEPDYAKSVQQTSDGGFIITGGTQSNNFDAVGNDGGPDFWLVKLSEGGELIWQKTLGGTKNEFATSGQQTADGGYILTGYAFSNDGDVSGVQGTLNDFWVVKLSPNSTPNSTPTTNPSTETHSLTLSPNPAQNTLTIQTQEPGKTGLQIYNLLGQALLHQSLELSDLGAAQVDISQLPRGLYLITATGASGQVYSGRFFKGE